MLEACYSSALLIYIHIERDLTIDIVSEEILNIFVNIDKMLCLIL